MQFKIEQLALHPRDPQKAIALLDKLDRVALLERRKAQYEKVLSELFPS